jgi:hypothetical protein
MASCCDSLPYVPLWSTRKPRHWNYGVHFDFEGDPVDELTCFGLSFNLAAASCHVGLFEEEEVAFVTYLIFFRDKCSSSNNSNSSV